MTVFLEMMKKLRKLHKAMPWLPWWGWGGGGAHGGRQDPKFNGSTETTGQGLRSYIEDSEFDPKDGGREVSWNRVVGEPTDDR